MLSRTRSVHQLLSHCYLAKSTSLFLQHARILQAISDLDSAPTSLADTTNLLKALKQDLAERTEKLAALTEARKAASKGLDSLAHSPVKRLYVRVAKGGKDALKERLEDGERKFMEAAQKEHNEGIALQEVKEAVREAEEQVCFTHLLRTPATLIRATENTVGGAGHCAQTALRGAR